MNFYQGKFQPKNPSKYKGDSSNIVFRSSWELRCMNYFDGNPDIIQWSSEELIIPYKSPVDNKYHRYFVDFVIKNKMGEVFVVEVKPASQTVQPKSQKKVTKRYLQEVYTWGVNQAKWEAAEEFCRKRGWTFVKITENDLFKKLGKGK